MTKLRRRAAIVFLAAGCGPVFAQDPCPTSPQFTLSPVATSAGASAFTLIVTRNLAAGAEGFSADEANGFSWQGPASPNSQVAVTAQLVSNIRFDLSIPAALVTTSGSATIRYKVDPSGLACIRTLPLFTINAPPGISTSSLTDATAGQNYSATLSATAGTPAYSWSVAAGSTLPAGLALSTAGILSGVPTTGGNFSFTVRVTDAAGVSDQRQLALVITASGPAPACVNFPAGLVPFSSVAYVTAGTGDLLVVGALANGLNTLSTIPLPAGVNQVFCDSQVQLAPGQFFSNVYVPTPAERNGSFSAFSGQLVNPATGIAYAGGVIPTNQLGAVYAFRIGAIQPPASSSRNWSPTGSMARTRSTHVAALLPDGKVLVVSGPTAGNSAELYDPARGVFTLTGSTRFTHVSLATLTLLNDGKVLLVGGNAGAAGAELYDPSSGKFSATGVTTMNHVGSTATLLPDGRVLLAGGQALTPNTSTAAAEIFDPRNGSFAQTGAMSTARIFHTATLLPDGRVLVTGGNQFTASSGQSGTPLASAEIFDPATGRFSTTGSMQFTRTFHFAAALPNGRVLVGGGNAGSATAAEVFDPAIGAFSLSGSLNLGRTYATATPLPNGQVLVAGGLSTSGSSTATSTSSELFTPASGVFVSTDSMGAARRQHTATLLLDGRVLVTGGNPATGGEAGTQLAELYTPVTQGLVTSQTGLTFRGAQGAGVLPTQTVAVLSPTDTIPYNVSVKTFTGGGWLRATPSSGTAGPTTTPVSLTITADATGLAAADYYGSVTLSPTDGKHPPVSVAIVLTIVAAGAAAAPGVSPTGLVFLPAAGTSPAAQTFVVANVTSRAINFTATATSAANFLDFTPKTGAIAAGQSQTFTVTVASATLTAGVRRGSIQITFGDNTARTVDVLLVVAPAAGTSAMRAATNCAASRLLPVLTSVGAGFSTPLAWPTPVIVQVVDDCGTAINAGTVTASFTNGDPPISLLAIGNGTWSATWVPVRAVSSTGVRADARASTLSGTVQVTGQVAANPKVPVVAAGGVLSSGDYLGSPAQGLLASIFGVALADGALGNSSLPLPDRLGSTIVTVSGVQLPVLYVSENQVNVFVPYELAANSPHQLIVQRANAISVPVPISVFENQPAILATAGNGAGQGHVYKINSAGAQVLADATSPAKAGDVLVIYSVGLGPVNPPLKSGDAAPLTFLSPTTGTASVTIGGVPAKVDFAGLTPGFSGLYQVNVTVPAGIAPGNQVAVTVAVNGRAGAGNIFMAIQ